jgi:integrase/recombinase XerD
MKRKSSPNRSLTFATALEGYWLARRSNFSPATVRDYSVTFVRFEAYIGDRPLVAITAADIQRFLDTTRDERKLAKKTVCNMWVALSSFYTWAETELHIDHAIRGHVQQPEYRSPAIQIYTEVEIKAMLGACLETAPWQTRRGKATRSPRPESLRDQAIITTLVDTGVRASELCDFQRSDYIQTQGRLLVRHGKGDKQRVVFLGQAGRRTLWRYLVTRPDIQPADFIFATKTNQRMERNNLGDTLKRIGQRAGVLGVTVHRFRHTFAVNFLRNGGNVLELQEILGHERMETVRIYARLAEVDLAAAQRRASPADRWRL